MALSRYYKYAHFYFRNMYGENFSLSPWQQEIYKAIYEPSITRVAIKTITQYGKSEVASMALLHVCCERREKVLVIAPSEKQARIIFNKIIDHIFDHPFITGMVDYKTTGNIESLKQERSKSRITFKTGSEIMLLTADAGNLQREAKNLMGFGATLILVDESSLIPDSMFTKILRMVGGVRQGKIIQLGNPFESNHFGKAFDDPNYRAISVDWRVALKEKRVTQQFLDEARMNMTELDWLIFYETQFPEGGAEDALIPRSWIQLAINQAGCEGEFVQTGLDVARFGRDKTVYALRKGGVLALLEQTEKMDTMEVTGWTIGKFERDKPDVHCTDVVGLGAGVHDRLEEIQGEEERVWTDCELLPINVGESPTTKVAKDKFHNLRAQMYWNLRIWFKPDEKSGHSDICIPNDPELIKQLEEVRYKYSSERKIKIEPKDEMKKRLGNSPDKADAVALAFWNDMQEEEEPQLFIAEG